MFALIQKSILLLLISTVYLQASTLSQNHNDLLQLKPRKEITILQSFVGDVIHDYEVLLQWKILLERKNNSFKIERSDNLQDFETIGFIPGKGKGENHYYHILDENLTPGTWYYRLSHKNENGSFRELSLITVYIQGNKKGVVSEKFYDRFANQRIMQLSVEIEPWTITL